MTETAFAPTTSDIVDLHEHAWCTQSAHRTSEGTVLYVRCACGARRIDLQPAALMPPVAVSRVAGTPTAAAPASPRSGHERAGEG